MEGYYSPLRPHVCGASCGKVRYIIYYIIISLYHCISLDSIRIAVSDQQTKRDAAILRPSWSLFPGAVSMLGLPRQAVDNSRKAGSHHRVVVLNTPSSTGRWAVHDAGGSTVLALADGPARALALGGAQNKWRSLRIASFCIQKINCKHSLRICIMKATQTGLLCAGVPGAQCTFL